MSTRTKSIIALAVLALLVYAFFALDIPYRKDIDTAAPEASTTVSVADMIYVESPESGALISSPVKLSGFARGPWFFEASFPVEIVAADGTTVIASGAAAAEGSWMTNDFVPWKATLSFKAASTSTSSATGFIRLRKDNPSGDPARDASLDIPVRFATSTGTIKN